MAYLAFVILKKKLKASVYLGCEGIIGSVNLLFNNQWISLRCKWLSSTLNYHANPTIYVHFLYEHDWHWCHKCKLPNPHGRTIDCEIWWFLASFPTSYFLRLYDNTWSSNSPLFFSPENTRQKHNQRNHSFLELNLILQYGWLPHTYVIAIVL